MNKINRALCQTNFQEWSELQLLEFLVEGESRIEVEQATKTAQAWWMAFRRENRARLTVVAKCIEEIRLRGKTLNDFFWAYLYSYTENIQAVLFYMDYAELADSGYKGIRERTDLYSEFTRFARTLLEHPDVVTRINAPDFQELPVDSKAEALFSYAQELGLTFLGQSPNLWYRFLQSAYIGGKEPAA